MRIDPHDVALDDASLIYLNDIQECFDINVKYYYYGFYDSVQKYTGIALRGAVFVNLDPSFFFEIFDNIFIDKKIVVLIK